MTTRVLVVGGGYAGVMAANRLHRSEDVEVTLVNPRPDFVDRIRLHQHAAGTREAPLPFARLLNDRARLVVDSVARIDANAHSVELESGRGIGYDHLVYAVGSRPAVPYLPGVAEHAHPVASLEHAERLRAALQRTPASAPVVVVGGGPTGIEVATELAEAGRPVTLVTAGDVVPYLHATGRRLAAGTLDRLGVQLVEQVSVAEVRADAVRLVDGRMLPSTVTVWTAGFAVPDLARRSGLTTDEAGRLLTDETMTSVDDDCVVAAGDAADPSGQPMRMSCQAAIPLGLQAAETILRRIDGERPAPVDNGFYAMCLSLGRRSGVVQLARADDTARGVAFGGRPAAWQKEAVCRSVLALVRFEARHPGRYRWSKDRDRAARLEGRTTPVRTA